MKDLLRRRNIFKNIVLRRLYEVKNIRKKPKLTNIMAACFERYGVADGKEILRIKLI
jgi:hypothetical protein